LKKGKKGKKSMKKGLCCFADVDSNMVYVFNELFVM
jgi:hypothetical protein